MDEIYQGKTREEKIELVYSLMLQNTNGRENPDEMFKLGIEACYDELIDEWKDAKTDPPKTAAPILMQVDEGYSILIGRFIEDTYWECDTSETEAIQYRLRPTFYKVVRWKYIDLPPFV